MDSSRCFPSCRHTFHLVSARIFLPCVLLALLSSDSCLFLHCASLLFHFLLLHHHHHPQQPPPSRSHAARTRAGSAADCTRSGGRWAAAPPTLALRVSEANWGSGGRTTTSGLPQPGLRNRPGMGCKSSKTRAGGGQNKALTKTRCLPAEAQVYFRHFRFSCSFLFFRGPPSLPFLCSHAWPEGCCGPCGCCCSRRRRRRRRPRCCTRAARRPTAHCAPCPAAGWTLSWPTKLRPGACASAGGDWGGAAAGVGGGWCGGLLVACWSAAALHLASAGGRCSRHLLSSRINK